MKNMPETAEDSEVHNFNIFFKKLFMHVNSFHQVVRSEYRRARDVLLSLVGDFINRYEHLNFSLIKFKNNR